MSVDRNKVCRLCLSKDKLSDIFLVVNKKVAVSYAALIKECLSIEVSREDGLPPWACIKCSTRIRHFYSYKLRCRKTVESLRAYINEDTAEINEFEIKFEHDSMCIPDDDYETTDKDEGIIIKVEDKLQTDDRGVLLQRLTKAKRRDCSQTIDSLATSINDDKETLVKIERLDNDLSLDFILDGELGDESKEVGLEIEDEDNVKYIPQDDYISDDVVMQNDEFETIADLKEEGLIFNVEDLSAEGQSNLLQRLSEAKERNCPLCSKKYTIHKSLINHVKSFHFNIKYYCDICDKYVSNEEQHKQLHLQSKWANCTECEAEFLNKRMYIEHVLKLHNNGGYDCECGRSFKFLETLNGHKESDHLKIYACYFCSALYSRKDKVVAHMDLHLSGKVIRRQPIKNKYNNLKIEDIPEVVGGKCPICNFSASKPRVIDHIKSAHFGYKYFCEICKKYYMSESRHIYNNHVRPDCTTCKKCGKSFKLKKDYTIHMREAHKVIERKYNCHCGKSFSHLHKFNRHKYHEHNESPFVCEFCSKGYLRKSKLECHVLTVHTEVRVRKYKCPICSKAFYTSDSLRNHKMTHKQSVECYCDHCGRAFKLKKLLRAHITSHDPLWKPHACMVCGKRFRRTDHRNVHQRTVHSVTEIQNDV